MDPPWLFFLETALSLDYFQTERSEVRPACVKMASCPVPCSHTTGRRRGFINIPIWEHVLFVIEISHVRLKKKKIAMAK